MTSHQQLDEMAVIDQVQKGQTQQEVRKTFGAPKQSQTASTGKSLDMYRVYLPRVTANPGARSGIVEVRALHVLYTPGGIVEDFSYYRGEAKTVSSRMNNHWQAGQWFGPADTNKIQPGVTTRDDLIQMFGRPTIEALNVYGDKVMSWFYGEGSRGGLFRGREMSVLLDAKMLARDFALRDIQP